MRGRLRQRLHRGTFPTGEYPGDVIHLDFCGLFNKAPGKRGEKYWLIQVDGFTRITYTQACTLRVDPWLYVEAFIHKLESYEPNGRRCRRIYMDRAGEFRSDRFKNWAA